MCLAEGQMYVAGRLGYGWASDVDRSWGGVTDSTIKYDSPLSLGAAFGYRYNWARLEGEIGYYNVSVKEGQGRSGALRGVDGRDLFYTFMLNAYADLRNSSPLHPVHRGRPGGLPGGPRHQLHHLQRHAQHRRRRPGHGYSPTSSWPAWSGR